MSNVIIIGNGPAGVSASLYTARAGVETTIIGSGLGALGKAEKIENYYGFAEPVDAKEMMAAMMEGMPLRQLLSFVPGIKREMLEQMVGALNEGVAYNKKNVSMEMKALCQTRN